MPSTRSVYKKVQIVLDMAKSISYEDINGLIKGIYDSNIPSFITRKYDPQTDKMRLEPSQRVIKRTIKLCQLLSLINVEGHLTDIGRKAISEKKYEGIVRSSVLTLLKNTGHDIEKINRMITQMLKSSQVILPTAKALWSESHSRIPLSKFSLLMTLLSQCGGASASQSKIYLHIADDEKHMKQITKQS